MTLALSHKAEEIVQSEIRNMSIECDRVQGINLSQGICDTPIPEATISGVNAGMREGFNSYTRYDGLEELRKALVFKLERDNHMKVELEGEIVVSAGSTGAFYCACLALLNAGDEVMLFEPYYGYHVNTLLTVGAVPRHVALAPGATFTDADLEAAFTSRTRGIMICTPANPSGKVWTRDELARIGRFAAKKDIFIFTDEVYEYLVYDGHEHISPATVPECAGRTISMFSYSKTFSITGWRLGYAVCDPRWARMIGYMNDLVYVCAPAPLQIGVARGIMALGTDYYTRLRDDYQRKRDILCGALEQAGLRPSVPAGAYYVLADLSRLDAATSKDRAMMLLERTGVACVPGESFYAEGRGEHIGRFCFAKDEDVLREAGRRLARL